MTAAVAARSLTALVLALAVAACGGRSRDPYDRPDGDGPNPPPEYAEDRPPRAQDDPWSIDAMLPRSGDPERPNVKVEVVVLDVASARDLQVRASLAGTVVRGVVDLRGSLSAGARSSRARSRTSTFIVVQAGREAEIAITDDCRALVGPYQALWVNVLHAGLDGVDLEVAPVSPTTRRGESAALSTRVSLSPGQAILLGGASESRQREDRGLGRHAEADDRRETVVLLRVDIIG